MIGTSPTSIQLHALRATCARWHGATISSTRVLSVEPGYGRNTNMGMGSVFVNCDDSDAIVTLEYTVAAPVEKRARIASYRALGRVIARSRGPYRATYAYLRGEWILWMD